MSPDGPYANALPHPRFYGTIPAHTGPLRREEPAVLTLENAIYLAFPAQRMGKKDRGLVKEGLTADLVVFEETVIDRSGTTSTPGIPYVLVNGVLVDEGKHTGARPGRVLARVREVHGRALIGTRPYEVGRYWVYPVIPGCAPSPIRNQGPQACSLRPDALDNTCPSLT